MASSARIDELRKKFDENPRRYFAPLANEYRKAGDLEQAIFICQEYLPQQPGHMSGHIVYGQALFDLGRRDEAKAVFETALSLDPENLIALKHLGDIARMGGDPAGARVWYERVLEADPRNEEIAQLMASLPSPEPVAEPHAASTPAASAVDHLAPTPSSFPAESERVSPAESLAIEQSTDLTFDVPGSMSSPPPTPTQPAASGPLSQHAPREEDLLDLDSFDLGGVPLGTPRETTAASSDLEIEMSSSTDLSFGNEPAVDAQPSVVSGALPALDDEDIGISPFGRAAEPVAGHEDQPTEDVPTPTNELATDVVLGLPDDGVASSFIEDGETFEGLESFEAGTLPNVPTQGESLATESFFDTPVVDGTPPHVESIAEPMADQFTAAMQTREEPIGESSEDATPEAVEPAADERVTEPAEVTSAPGADDDRAPAEPAAAFVTETMATLYLEQGHFESALDIYRKLAAQRPDDAALRERLWEVETRVAEQRSMPAEPGIAGSIAEPDIPAARSYGGPTIREFLSDIAARRPGGGASRVLTPDEAAFHSAETPLSTPVVASADEPAPEVIEQIAPPAAPSRPTPSSSETVSGSIGVLFSGADPAADDVAAAQTLADAFQSESSETAPLQGVPAHRASSELSLNHVFKGATQARTTEEGAEEFSFDEFFTEGAAAGPTPAADAPSVPAEGADDIAQFNAWLNGLKKT
jgi:tetratricopeptide (TPR) repeat protein